MVNLNRDQIKALSEKISNEIREEITKYNRKLEEKISKILKKKLNLKENKTLLEYNNYCVKNDYIDNRVKQYLQKKYEDEIIKFGKEKSYIYNLQHLIKLDLIIETIECENLNELIEKIKIKYLS